MRIIAFDEGDFIPRVEKLKGEIMEWLRAEADIGHFNVDIIQQIFSNQGYTLEEFARAYNGLVMDRKIRCNNEVMWLAECEGDDCCEHLWELEK